jgi:hypothetical protein
MHPAALSLLPIERGGEGDPIRPFRGQLSLAVDGHAEGGEELKGLIERGGEASHDREAKN